MSRKASLKLKFLFRYVFTKDKKLPKRTLSVKMRLEIVKWSIFYCKRQNCERFTDNFYDENEVLDQRNSMLLSWKHPVASKIFQMKNDANPDIYPNVGNVLKTKESTCC